jgi:hypothetical protein
MHAADILGRGFAAHQDAGLAPRRGCLRAAEKTTRIPVAAPGLAAMPRAITSRAPAGSTWWCSSSDSARGSTRSTASSRDDPVLGQRHRDPQAGPRRALHLAPRPEPPDGRPRR